MITMQIQQLKKTAQIKTDNDDGSLEEKIISLLKTNTKGMSCKMIAKALNVSKKDVNHVIYGNTDMYSNVFFIWKIKERN